MSRFCSAGSFTNLLLLSLFVFLSFYCLDFWTFCTSSYNSNSLRLGNSYYYEDDSLSFDIWLVYFTFYFKSFASSLAYLGSNTDFNAIISCSFYFIEGSTVSIFGYSYCTSTIFDISTTGSYILYLASSIGFSTFSFVSLTYSILFSCSFC